MLLGPGLDDGLHKSLHWFSYFLVQALLVRLAGFKLGINKGFEDSSIDGVKNGFSLGSELGIDKGSWDSCVVAGWRDGIGDGLSLGLELGISEGTKDGFEDGFQGGFEDDLSLDFEIGIDEGASSHPVSSCFLHVPPFAFHLTHSTSNLPRWLLLFSTALPAPIFSFSLFWFLACLLCILSLSSSFHLILTPFNKICMQ
jgi:hypothetical protein